MKYVSGLMFSFFLTLQGQAASNVSGTVVLPSGFQLIAVPVPRTDVSGQSHLEMPPTILAGGWTQYILSSIESSICSSPKDLFRLDSSMQCWQTTKAVVDSVTRTKVFTASQVTKEAPWRRNYHGIMSAQVANVTGYGPSLIAITHGENKGETTPYLGSGRGSFLNTVAPNMKNTVPASATGSKCLEANGCYFAFANLSWTPYNANTNWGMQAMTDMGPITWPAAGYVTADGKTKISNGPRHPSSLIKDGYLYVFYVDIVYTNGSDGNYSKYEVPGRTSGVKVVRAPVGSVTPANFRAYYDGSFSQATLPAGFSTANMLNFVSKTGPLTTPLFGSHETISFSVSQVRDTGAYVGVEEYADYGEASAAQCPGQTRIALRFSSDLVNWSARKDIMGCKPYGESVMHYPKFLNNALNSNDVVEKEGFFILGTGQNTGNIQFPLSALKVRLDNLTVSP